MLPKIIEERKHIARQAIMDIYIKDYNTALLDAIISTEALEHDKHFALTLLAMYSSLKSGGLLLITAAGEGRDEHGTTEFEPLSSPGTNDYYKNVSNEMFIDVLPTNLFSTYFINQDKEYSDFQFYGIKK